MNNNVKKICPFCNYLGRDSADFCPHCGFQLISKCPKCSSSTITAFAKHCCICGYRFADCIHTHQKKENPGTDGVPCPEYREEKKLQPDKMAEKQRGE